jgi:hypothetical protein
VIGGPAGVGGFYADKAKIIEIEAVDEGVDEANRIALVDPVTIAVRGLTSPMPSIGNVIGTD